MGGSRWPVVAVAFEILPGAVRSVTSALPSPGKFLRYAYSRHRTGRSELGKAS